MIHHNKSNFGLAVLAFFFYLTPLAANAGIPDVRCQLINQCDSSSKGSSGGGGGAPSTGSKVKINPAAVPTEKGYGIESIFFSNEGDLSFVRGTGRFGAAISPSNSEDTFFGQPGFEYSFQTQERKTDREKFPNNKVTLATAFNLFEKTGSGLNNYSLNVGVMGRYNKISYGTTGGGGLNGSLGAFSFGYSVYNDQSAMSYDDSFGGTAYDVIKYQVHTYNLGLFLHSLSLDYSNLKVLVPDYVEPAFATVQTYTATLSMKKAILTLSQRVEESPTMAYNYETKQMENKNVKVEYFGGVRFGVTKNIMLGALYNYYLLREFSLSTTLYF
ncbi:hypothetical protein ACES2L_01465 [Bdellovibrio bacteriovorus]